MTRLTALRAGFGALLAFLLPSAPAHAVTNAVTYIASTGSNNNTSQLCSRTLPCQSFMSALSVTSPGGTVLCLDPLFDFGPVVIGIDVTIDCSQTKATIFGPQNTGVTVNGGANVTLRGLSIYSDDTYNGTYGILVAQSATVHVEKCHIHGFKGNPGSGISVQVGGQLIVEDSTIEGNGAGGIDLFPTSGDLEVKIHNSNITSNLHGILAKPSGFGTLELTIDHSHIDNNNGGGVRADGTGGGTVTVAIADSSMSLNAGNGFVAVSGQTGNVYANLMRDVFARNTAWGVQSNQSFGGLSTVALGASMLSSNLSGALNFVSGATLLTYGDNQNFGFNGTGFSGAIAQQ